MMINVEAPATLVRLSRDGLGERLLLEEERPGTVPLVYLRVAPDHVVHPGFEPALRQRVAEVSRFFHPAFAPVLRVDRSGDLLTVVSEAAGGVCLADILRASERRRLAIEASAALHITDQLLRTLAALHARGPGLAHGAIAPSRLYLAQPGTVVVTDYVFGSALERLQIPPSRLWRESRIVVPSAWSHPEFNARTDVMQIGLVALALILGRELDLDEYPGRLIELLKTATELDASGRRVPLAPIVKIWLARALQIADGFTSIADACQALEHLFAGATRYLTSLIALRPVLTTLIASSAERPAA